MHVLMNENTQIRVNGTPLAIAGVTDTAALNWGLEGPDPEKALSGLSKDITKLMLSHRPSLAPESAKAGASLQLSGHTHGGQLLPLQLGMRLGEGSGCPLLFRVMQGACAVLNHMATFPEAAIEDEYLTPIREGDAFTVDKS